MWSVYRISNGFDDDDIEDVGDEAEVVDDDDDGHGIGGGL